LPNNLSADSVSDIIKIFGEVRRIRIRILCQDIVNLTVRKYRYEEVLRRSKVRAYVVFASEWQQNVLITIILGSGTYSIGSVVVTSRDLHSCMLRNYKNVEKYLKIGEPDLYSHPA
jgi:hypothetical protein